MRPHVCCPMQGQSWYCIYLCPSFLAFFPYLTYVFHRRRVTTVSRRNAHTRWPENRCAPAMTSQLTSVRWRQRPGRRLAVAVVATVALVTCKQVQLDWRDCDCDAFGLWVTRDANALDAAWTTSTQQQLMYIIRVTRTTGRRWSLFPQPSARYQLTLHGRRNGSDRPGGCRTNNLANENFCSHYINFRERESTLKKISKIGATRCQILRLKYTNLISRWGSLQRSPHPVAVFKATISKGRERRGKGRERGEKGKGGREQG